MKKLHMTIIRRFKRRYPGVHNSGNHESGNVDLRFSTNTQMSRDGYGVRGLAQPHPVLGPVMSDIKWPQRL
jgi:hypothetical protein